MTFTKKLKERENSLYDSNKVVKNENLKYFNDSVEDPYKNDFIKKIIEIIKNILFLIIEKLDDNKIYIYVPFFIVFFLLYYLINVPKIFQRPNINLDDEASDKKKFYIVLGADIVFLILVIVMLVCYGLFTEKFKENKALFISCILVPILLSSVLIFFSIYYTSEYLTKVAESKILMTIFIVILSIFNVIFFTLFTYNIDNELNIEFFVTLLLLSLFFAEYVISALGGMKNLYYKLVSFDYSILTINCLNKNNIEAYEDINNNSNNQIIEIKKNYGDNYLKTIGNIPIGFFNKNMNDYQDLVLADFYYPGSNYTYLANSALNGTPNLDAIKIAIDTFKCRIIHLDIFSDSSDPYDPKANPVVRCENMKEGSKPLDFNEVLALINKWAWVTNDPNNLSYPFFLYMNFKFDKDNQNIYIKIYRSLLKFFSKNLVDKKYSFAGRNSAFSVSKAKMLECLNKIIIITNIYPTKSILDELINVSSNILNNNFNLFEYKDSYIKFDKIGVSQDNDKTELLNSSKNNMNIYYSIPNEKYRDNNQDKAGLFNPSFQDCAQYGIQSTLMYVFVPDENLKKWNAFFKNKNNLDPVLKDELLRSVNGVPPKENKQNPVVGLQKPQKYCVVPGMISTEKSNLSSNVENSSC